MKNEKNEKLEKKQMEKQKTNIHHFQQKMKILLS